MSKIMVSVLCVAAVVVVWGTIAVMILGLGLMSPLQY